MRIYKANHLGRLVFFLPRDDSKEGTKKGVCQLPYN